MPVIFLISAAFHCALILAVIQVHGGAGTKCETGGTVIEVGLVGLTDLAETAPTPWDTGKNDPGHFLERKSLPMPVGGAPLTGEKKTADGKKKNRAVPVKGLRAAHGGETDRSRIAGSAPVMTEEATSAPASKGDGGAGLSPTAVNHGMDTPLDSYWQGAGKNGATESAPGHELISAAPRGSGKEKARRGYLVENFLYIKNRITRHLSYPPVARRLKWQGIAVVTFCILENGLVENIKIAHSSGHQLLDNHVIDTVKRLQPFPKPPVRAEITIPVKYVLSN